jgi:excisionase family DNA binding protein
MAPSEKLLLGVPEVAREVGVDPKFIRRGVEEGTIPATRVGRLIKVPMWWIRQQRDGVAPRNA